MDALVELLAAMVVALAAAAFSQFGISVEQPKQPPVEERAVRRSPVAAVAETASANCPEQRALQV
jgi:hypothetical protein